MTDVIQETTTPRATPGRRRRAVGAGFLVVAVVACGAGWRWLHSPDPLADYPVGAATAPVGLGHSVYTDTAVVAAVNAAGDGPASIRVTIATDTPVVAENTSNAQVELLVCTRNGGTIGIGMQDGDLTASCSRVSPFRAPERLDLGFMTAQIILKVTPHQAGRVRITGFDVTYSQGLQRRTQHVGADITLTTPAGP